MSEKACVHLSELKRSIHIKLVAGNVLSDAAKCVFAYALFKKVRFALQANHFHERERVFRAVFFGLVQGAEESVRAELYVFTHERGVHANQVTWECFANKLAFDLDSILNDGSDGQRSCRSNQQRVNMASKVSVQAFISADEGICLA